MTEKESAPLIFDIKHFALDDGPGIRTTVFFKGCVLSCRWCHNPESICPTAEIAFHEEKCIRCGECSSVCPSHALTGRLSEKIKRKKCIRCGACVLSCPAAALKTVGVYYPPDELIDIIVSDLHFYKSSNGGVTFSGGEPTMHMDYLFKVLKVLQEKKIHIAIQTCGLFDLSEFRKLVLPFVDLIFFDMKMIDAKKHKKYTNSSNEQIVSNFTEILHESKKRENFRLIARTPLVPGINDSSKDIAALLEFYRQVDHKDFMFLPYNSSGQIKKKVMGIR